MSKFEVSDRVKFIGKYAGDNVPGYNSEGEHIKHGSTIIGNLYGEEGGEVICYYNNDVAVEYEDSSGERVCLNFSEEYLELFRKDELKNTKMDIEGVKKLDKKIIADAKAKVLEVRAEKQTEEAVAVLTELFDRKDTIEESIGEQQKTINEISKNIKVFDVKK